VYATSNHYGWGTKSWLFTTATRPAPTGLTATPGATTADLAWDATEGTLIYTVYRSTTEGSGYAEIGTTTTNSYADTELTSGTTYYYKTTATAGTSTSAQSAAVSVTTLNVPAAPTNVAATPDCSATDKIIVTWDAVAGATSYDIEAYDNGASEWYDNGHDITDTTATITVAGGYKAYPIHVKAKNAAGSSAWANAAADGWPASPSPTLTVSGTTAASVTLAWTDIAGQTYDVYRSAHANGNYKLLASSQSNGYTDNAVFSGSKYYYKLQITKTDCGTVWSNAVNATTGYTLGTPVASVTSKTASEVTIGWSAVAGAGAYNIYRSVDNVNYDYIGLTKNTSYTDNLNRGNGLKTIYYYKVSFKGNVPIALEILVPYITSPQFEPSHLMESGPFVSTYFTPLNSNTVFAAIVTMSPTCKPLN
jgi:fibronectin type 3 domain-containing protein